ncbi:MAG: hypothetical protein GY795_24020 [Desulfobacterales bacterium]|nr:hypothetical protein [Desulfobacterales bacterium]
MIAILEDNTARYEEMLKALKEQGIEYEVKLFDNAPEMTEWLKHNINTLKIISLDHDLGPNREINGKISDPGNGRDVADFLAKHKPVCHIIIHTTNYHARPGMESELRNNKWNCTSVYPFNDLEWIKSAWIKEVKNNIK